MLIPLAAALTDTTAAQTLSITENGSGTYDITTDDSETTFTVTIADSNYTHQNGTWGPFDTADLNSGPINIVAAKITGNTTLGSVLTADSAPDAGPGVWIWDTANGTATVAKIWQRGDVDISGETGTTYTLAGADSGAAMENQETATDSAGSRVQDSNTITASVFASSGIGAMVIGTDFRVYGEPIGTGAVGSTLMVA